MLGFLFQILVIFPLISHITHHKFQNSRGVKFMACFLIVQVLMCGQISLFFSKKEDSIYDVMDITRFTPKNEIRKAFRTASLKYHPDKNKDPEALPIYLSLNENVEILRDDEKREYYDYFDLKQYDPVPKPTAMGDSEDEYKFKLVIQRLFYSLGHIPGYIAWLFIPIAYLEQKQRPTKFAILLFVLAMGALDLGFMTHLLPTPLVLVIYSITPSTWTYKTLFKLLHVVLPHLITLIIAFFDIYVLKVYEQKEDNENKSKKIQNKTCRKMIKNQEEMLEVLKSTEIPSESERKDIVNMNKKIYQQMKKILSIEEETDKDSQKWSIGKVVSMGFFLMFIINQTT